MTKEELYEDFLQLSEAHRIQYVNMFLLTPKLFNEDEKWAIIKYLSEKSV